jgi:hypothetical protein
LAIKMFKKYSSKLFLAVSLLLLYRADAQTSDKILGQPYVALETTDFLLNLSTNKPSEEFLPYLRLYRLSYYQDGISIDFNSDIAVYRVSLYDSGYTYQRYKQPLPFEIKWGMSLLEIEELTGIHDAVKGNEYATTLISEDYQMECYFTDKLLSHMRLTASVKVLQKHTEKLKAANQMRLLPNGVVKEGNVIDGSGTMIWGNGTAVYKGKWSYGLPHGRGEYLDTFGNRYAGDFKLGFFWGQGDFYSKAYGYSYSGAYAMSSKHGEGRIQYNDDTKYQGYWVQDNMHGGGVYSIGNRYIYKGEVVQNKLTGQGIVETPDGTISGTFKEGKPNGVCTQTSKDNIQSITGPFKNGKKDGKFSVTVLGDIRTVYYENDIEILPKN